MINRNHRLNCILGFTVCLLIWKLFRTDWTVECEYCWADFHPPCSVNRGTATYTPPVSPVWNPPSPGAIAERSNASWSDPEFFAAGGSYGPVGKATLGINWALMIAKIFSGSVLAWLVLKQWGNLRAK